MPENIVQTIELEAALSPDYEKAFRAAEGQVKQLDSQLKSLGTREKDLAQLSRLRADSDKAAADGDIRAQRRLDAQYARLAERLGMTGQSAAQLDAELRRVRSDQERLTRQREPFASQLRAREAARDVEQLRAAYERFSDPRIARQLAVAEQRARSLGVTFGRQKKPASEIGQNIRQLGLDAAQSAPGMGRLISVFGKLPPQAVVVVGALAAVGAATVGLGKKTLELGVQTATTYDEIGKNARALGVSVESYQRLAYAMRQGGVADAQFSDALKTLNQKMDEAAQGSQEARQSFKNLGVSVSDIKSKNPEEIFLQLSDGIAKIDDPAKRAKASMQLFGGSGMRVAEAMRGGSDALRQLGKDAEKSGNVLSSEQTQLAEDTTAAIERMRMGFEGIKNQIAVKVMPIVMRAAQDITRYLDEHSEDIKRFTAEIIVPLAESVASAAVVAVHAIGSVMETWQAGSQIAENTLHFCIDEFPGIASDLWERLKAKAIEMWEWISGIPARLRQLGADAINSLLQGLKDKYNDIKKFFADFPLIGRLVGDGDASDVVPAFGDAEVMPTRASAPQLTINNTIDARGASPGAGADVQRAIDAGRGSAYDVLVRAWAGSGLAYGG